jgi:proline iminopeptidase
MCVGTFVRVRLRPIGAWALGQGGAGVTQPDTVPGHYDEGMLDVGDGNQIYWQVGGTPSGKPAVVVHGGPGGGFARGGYRGLRRAGYQLVMFDQRGCGDSTPHASDPATDMRHNTTQHLIADMERLREHLGIERWLLYGYSWGSILSLAYAEQHPDRVSEIILAAVCVGRRRDINWLYREAGRFYPEQWERFVAGSGVSRDDDVLGAYARLVEDSDPAVREKATLDWCAWEDALVSHEPQGKSAVFASVPPMARRALVRICAHYFSNGAFIEDGQLIREAGRLAGIPGVMVHGRLDMNGPVEGAWELSRAWPDAQLLVAEDAGHFDSETKLRYIREAVNRFASR